MARERTEKGVPCLSVPGLRSSKAETVPVALWLLLLPLLLLLLLLPPPPPLLLLLLLLPMPMPLPMPLPLPLPPLLLLPLLLPPATLLFGLRLMNLRVGLDKGGGRGGHEEATRRTAVGMLLPSRKRIILKLRDRSDALPLAPLARRSRNYQSKPFVGRQVSSRSMNPTLKSQMTFYIVHLEGTELETPV